MKTYLKLIFSYFLFSICSTPAGAQYDDHLLQKIDSLKTVIYTAKHDSVAVNAYLKWDDLVYLFDPATDIEINLKCIEICDRALHQKRSEGEFFFFKRKLAKALNNLGLAYLYSGRYPEAEVYLLKSYKIRKELCDVKGISAPLQNLGIIAKNKGKTELAHAYYKKALLANYLAKNEKGMANSYDNLANLFQLKGDYSKGIDLAAKALKIREKISDEWGIAISLHNLAIANINLNEWGHALNLVNRSIEIRSKLADKKGLAESLQVKGSIAVELKLNSLSDSCYLRSLELCTELENDRCRAQAMQNLAANARDAGQLQKAKEWYQKSLEISRDQQDVHNTILGLIYLADLLLQMKDTREAKRLAEEALMLSKATESVEDKKSTSAILYRIHKSNNSFKDALEQLETHVELKDSLTRVENKEAIIKQKYQYEYAKKAAADSVAFAMEAQLRDAEIAKQSAEIKAKNNLQFALIGGLLLLSVFGGAMYNRFKVTSQQKRVIEAQKREVESQKEAVEKQHRLLEEKNTTIMESITYAKRIQTAILPPPRVVKEYLKESFILYLPKDIVAGDFYWMEQSGDLVMFAAADCTGHGVPGAMVSVICTNGLNRSVREFGLTDPADILNKTRDIVMLEFEKSDEEVKDGMDISLCVLDGYQLAWAGANNPLWIVRNGELLAWEPDKQPIGKFARHQPFTTHHITLRPGDMIYALTDGFQDQFGGEGEPGVKPGGRKFRPKALKELITSLAHRSPVEQRDALLTTFDQWRGNLEQVDDVCILGVRV